MRARNIKPGLYKNEDLAECSLAARFLAPGLWMMADREGRLEDRPKRIKGEIYPYDDVNVNDLLDELVRAKHIIRYNHGEQRFIQIVNFKEHQRPHSNEIKSVIPEYSAPCEKIEQPRSAELSTKDESASSLFTDTLTTDSLNPECSTTGSKLPSVESLPPAKKKSPPQKYDAEGEEFWELYPPNGASKFSAMKAYEAARKDGIAHETLIRSVAEYSAYLERSGTPAAHATTWLNQRRWTVNYPALEGRPSTPRREKQPSSTDRALSAIFRAGNRTGHKQPNGGMEHPGCGPKVAEPPATTGSGAGKAEKGTAGFG